MPWQVVSAVIGSDAQSDAAASAANSSREATNASAKATGDRLSFDQKQYSDGASDRQFASDMARQAATQQSADREKYNGLQDEQVVRGRVFQGAEDQILTDARSYNTTARSDQLASQATADVAQGFSNARGQSIREQQRAGVSPDSGRALALGNQMAIGQATAQATASNNARLKAETTSRALQMDAVGLGKGMIGNQATQAGLQLSAGNSAVGNSVVPINIASSAGGALSAGYGNASNSYGNVGRMQSDNFLNSQRYGMVVGNSVSSGIGNALQRFGDSSFGRSLFSPSVTDGGYGVGDGSSYGGTVTGISSSAPDGFFTPDRSGR